MIRAGIVNEKLIGRIKLLYERDNNSPLFLKTADSYITQNEIDKARNILEQGLKIFPDHPLALILLGKINSLKENIDEADALIKRASELLNSNQTYSHYKKELNLPDKSDSPFGFSRGNFFINNVEDDEVLSNESDTDNEESAIDNSLEDLAQQVMNARIDRNNNFSIPATNNQTYLPDKRKLASETLANIYLAQGEKNEAIKIFELLIERNPEKKEYYLGKISEIKFQ